MIIIKNEREIEAMKEACRISAGALKVAGEAVEPGVTTAEIDKLAYDYIKVREQSRTFSDTADFREQRVFR